MTQQQIQQLEVAFKTRGPIPLALIGEGIQLIIELVKGWIAKKKGVPVSEKLADMEWLINEVVMKAVHVQARQINDLQGYVDSLMSRVSKLEQR
jgi:hypothetical protein